MRHVARLGTEPDRLVDDADVGEQGGGSEEIGAARASLARAGKSRSRRMAAALAAALCPSLTCLVRRATAVIVRQAPGAVLGTGANRDHGA
jgi:NADPH:quinone reductase-like Zn-dependent oxidoreductase